MEQKQYVLRKSSQNYVISPVQLSLQDSVEFDNLDQFDAFAVALPLPQNLCWMVWDRENRTVARSSQIYKSIMEGYQRLFGNEPYSVYDLLQDMCTEIELIEPFTFPGPKGTTWKVHYTVDRPNLIFPNVFNGLHVKAVAVLRNAKDEEKESQTFCSLDLLDVRKLDRYHVSTHEWGRNQQGLKEPKAAKNYAVADKTKGEPQTLMERFERDLVPILARMTKLDPRLALKDPLVLSADHPLIDTYFPELASQADLFSHGAEYNAETGMLVYPAALLETPAALELKERKLTEVIDAEVQHYSVTFSHYNVDVEGTMAALAAQGIENCHDLLTALLERYNSGIGGCNYGSVQGYTVKVEDAETGERLYTIDDLPALHDLETAMAAAGQPFWSVYGCDHAKERVEFKSYAKSAAENAVNAAIGSKAWLKEEVEKRIPELAAENVAFGDGKFELQFSYHASEDSSRRGILTAVKIVDRATGASAVPYEHQKECCLTSAIDYTTTIYRLPTTRLSMHPGTLQEGLSFWCGLDIFKAWVLDHPETEPSFIDEAIIARHNAAGALMDDIVATVVAAYAPELDRFAAEAKKVARGELESCIIELPEYQHKHFLDTALRERLKKPGATGKTNTIRLRTSDLRDRVRLVATAYSESDSCAEPVAAAS